MKERILIIGLLSILWSCKSLKQKATDTKEVTPINTVTLPNSDDTTFPASWVGDYKGQLNMQLSNGKKSTFDMELRIGHADLSGHYPWTLIYNKEDLRAYGLVVVNKEKGLFLIDEYNSIKIEAYYLDRHLISKFNVMGSDLLVDYEKLEEDIRIRFYVSNAEPISKSGGEVFGPDTVAVVQSFPLLVFQEAILKKVK